MAPKNDLVIKIGANIENLKNKLAKARKMLRLGDGRTSSEAVSKKALRLKNLQKEYTDAYTRPAKEAAEKVKLQTMQEKQLYNARKKIINIKETMPAAHYKKFQENLKGVNAQYGTMLSKNDRLQLALNKTNSAIKQNSKGFAGWALSIMFFGMALKRVFDTIWKSSTKTFQDVMHSVDGTVTGFDMLEGAMAYLGFTAGQALEPITDFLVPIIWGFADWISQNEKLFASLTLTLGVLGSFFMVGGMGVLALNGFIDLASRMGLVTLEAEKIVGYNWAAIGKKIQKAVGFVAIAWGVVQAVDAFKDFENGNFSDGLIGAISAAVLTIGGITMFSNPAIGGALIAIGVGLNLLEENSFFTTLIGVFGVIGAIIRTFAARGAHDFKKLFSSVVSDDIASLAGKVANLLETLGWSESVSSALRGLEEWGTDPGEFNWGETWKEQYKGIIRGAKDLDSNIEKFKDEIDFEIQSGFNMEETKIHIMAIKTLLDEIYKTGDTSISTLPVSTLLQQLEQYRPWFDKFDVNQEDLQKYYTLEAGIEVSPTTKDQNQVVYNIAEIKMNMAEGMTFEEAMQQMFGTVLANS